MRAKRSYPRLETPEYRVIETPDALRAFDRNNCSTLRPQEAVQVLGRWPNGMLLIRSRYSLGWVPADAPLSVALEGDSARAWIEAHAPTP